MTVIGIIVSNKLGLSLSIEQDIGGSGGRLKIPKIWMILRGKLNLMVTIMITILIYYKHFGKTSLGLVTPFYTTVVHVGYLHHFFTTGGK